MCVCAKHCGRAFGLRLRLTLLSRRFPLSLQLPWTLTLRPAWGQTHCSQGRSGPLSHLRCLGTRSLVLLPNAGCSPSLGLFPLGKHTLAAGLLRPSFRDQKAVAHIVCSEILPALACLKPSWEAGGWQRPVLELLFFQFLPGFAGLQGQAWLLPQDVACPRSGSGFCSRKTSRLPRLWGTHGGSPSVGDCFRQTRRKVPLPLS